MRVQKAKIFNLRFLYSQDLSNCTTVVKCAKKVNVFLYSQDLSNCTTLYGQKHANELFLYSQDLSNCTTDTKILYGLSSFCTLKI